MSVTEQYLKQKREQKENLRLKLADTVNHDADRAARIFKVSAFTGLPEDVIDSDLDNLEERVRQGGFDPEKYRQHSPVFATFASENPYHLSVVKDDLENMSGIERAWAPLAMGWDSGWASVELGRIRSRQVGGDVREKDEERLRELRKILQPHEFGAENWFSKFLVKNAKMMPMSFASMREGVTMGLGGASIGIASASIGGPVTMSAAGAIGFGVGMITGTSKSAFDIERGLAYDEYLELGFDADNAKVAANAVGAVNMVLESFGITQTVKYMPGFSAVRGAIAKQVVDKVLVKPTFKRVSATYVSRFGEVLGSQVIQETLQEATTIAGGEILKGPDDAAMTWDQFTDRIGDIATETMQGAFILSSIGPTASYISDVHRAKRADQNTVLFKALGEAAEGSTTRQKVPNKYREFVERLRDKGPIEAIRVDVERFTEYFQEQGQDPEQVASELGIDLSEAQATGVDIEIPIDVYAEKVAPTEHHTALLPDLRMHEDEMTAREAEEWRNNADEIQKALIEQDVPEGHTPVTEIHDAVMGELIATGTELTAADKQAQLTEYVFSTLAERNEMDPIELFGLYWGGVRKEIPEALQKTDIDVYIDPLLDRLRAQDVPTQRQIFGESLVEFLTAKGGLIDEGGELAARDVAREFTKLMKDGKLTLDAAAELAFEAGFIPEHDISQFMDALDRELSGEPVFGRGADEQIADLARALGELEEFLGREDIDLNEMTNAEIRAALQVGQTFEQLTIDELTETAIIAATEDPTLLSKALLMLPKVPAEQDFGDLAFTDTVELEGTGQAFEVSQSAQKTFNRAVKRRGVIEKLLECVSG